ncbi:MAG: TIGR04282 family arsenosugar biosynthesis glycosyltransferase [Methylococcales bacterium]|nr:TIGR04282 family arsenosugar biosynthesis glycosyltransferase [Methylococcales bacterium]
MINNYPFPQTIIQIFCKAPIARQVKTRLTPELTIDQAAIVHQHLSKNIINQLSKFKLCPLQLWCSPNENHPFFQQLKIDYNLSLQVQSTGDLGLRMFNAINSGLNDYQQVLLIGCDCPSFNKQDFINAIEALERGVDVVIAPTEDGGYSLIGLNQSQISLFENMTWGHSEVLKTTLIKIKQQNLNCKILRQQWDIDTAGDWTRYCQQNDIQKIEDLVQKD